MLIIVDSRKSGGIALAFKPESLAEAVMERIVTLFSPTTGWSDQLWRSSPIDALRHCLDLVEGDARDGAKKYALNEAKNRIQGDLFIPRRDRGGVLKHLNVSSEKLVHGSTAHFALKSLVDELSRKYSSWVKSYVDALDTDVDVDSSSVSGEKLAWQLAAFLRSEGMSDQWIVNFATYQLRHDKQIITLAAAIELARNTAANDPVWTFFVPLKRRRSFNVTAPPLLRKIQFEERFKEFLPDVQVPENLGGVEIRVETIDKYAAINEAQLALRRIVERHRASHSKRKLTFATEAWVAPGSWSVPLSLEPELGIRVRELDSGGGREMFERVSEEVEAALDLLTAADQTSSRAATIAAWATLETLFASDGDFGDLASVADRAADVLVCMYVRDTFVSIATKHARAGDDDLAIALRDASNAKAARLVEGALPGHSMSVTSGRGLLARERAMVLTAPEVNTIRAQLAAVLHRLYDVRNQIVHAGRMAPFGLHRTYTESAVLLSALLDELLRQHRDTGRTAREVAGRAAWLLGRVASDREPPASLAELGDR